MHVLHELGPTLETVLAGEDELGISEDWIGNVWFVLAQAVDGRRIAVA